VKDRTFSSPVHPLYVDPRIRQTPPTDAELLIAARGGDCGCLARQADATDQEIQEAVAAAALARHWSTIFNGMQVDFQTFKKDLGGETPGSTVFR
jgi:hypothetical protein